MHALAKDLHLPGIGIEYLDYHQVNTLRSWLAISFAVPSCSRTTLNVHQTSPSVKDLHIITVSLTFAPYVKYIRIDTVTLAAVEDPSAKPIPPRGHEQ